MEGSGAGAHASRGRPAPPGCRCRCLAQRARRRRRSCTSARWRTRAASTACAPARSSRTWWRLLQTPRKCRWAGQGWQAGWQGRGLRAQPAMRVCAAAAGGAAAAGPPSPRPHTPRRSAPHVSPRRCWTLARCWMSCGTRRRRWRARRARCTRCRRGMCTRTARVRAAAARGGALAAGRVCAVRLTPAGVPHLMACWRTRLQQPAPALPHPLACTRRGLRHRLVPSGGWPPGLWRLPQPDTRVGAGAGRALGGGRRLQGARRLCGGPAVEPHRGDRVCLRLGRQDCAHLGHAGAGAGCAGVGWRGVVQWGGVGRAPPRKRPPCLAPGRRRPRRLCTPATCHPPAPRPQSKSMLSVRAHEADVNVLSWNRGTSYMLASGGDDGALRVWDLRAFAGGQPVANFTYHRCARAGCARVLAVGADASAVRHLLQARHCRACRGPALVFCSPPCPPARASCSAAAL